MSPESPQFFDRVVDLFKQQVTSTYFRSDVLKPLGWLIVILIPSFIVAGFTGNVLVIYGVGIAAAAAVALYLGIYGVCFFIDRDALRSERFVLNKLALGQKIYGDNVTGVLEPKDVTPVEEGETHPALLDRSS